MLQAQFLNKHLNNQINRQYMATLSNYSLVEQIRKKIFSSFKFLLYFSIFFQKNEIIYTSIVLFLKEIMSLGYLTFFSYKLLLFSIANFSFGITKFYLMDKAVDGDFLR